MTNGTSTTSFATVRSPVFHLGFRLNKVFIGESLNKVFIGEMIAFLLEPFEHGYFAPITVIQAIL